MHLCIHHPCTHHPEDREKGWSGAGLPGRVSNMADKIYISTRIFPVSEEQKAYLDECSKGPREVELIWRAPEEMTEEDYASASALMNFFPPQGVSKAANLEWMQLASAGADAFCKEGILPESCVLTNSSGAFSLSVGEHMLAMTLTMIRNFPQYKANQATHTWQDEGRIISIEGSTVAVLGMGDIGSFYARKMNALGARVIGVRRHECPKPEYLEEQVTLDRLDEILPKADIVAMVLPGGEETRHLINDRTLALMKENSYILNVGRGSSIDQAALCRALDSGHIRGAALDVTDPEPLPKDDPLWDYKNVLITPHVAGWWHLRETFNRVVRIFGTNLKHFVHSEKMENVVNRNLGY